METYLASTGFNQDSGERVNFGDYEFGLEFTPLVKGKILALKVKLPDINNSLRITIWDKATTSLINAGTVDVSAANTEFIFDITDLELVANKEYAITMQSDDWYMRQKTDAANAVYPIIAGNIRIDKYIWGDGVDQVYPAESSSLFYGGDLSFDFLQTE